MYLLPKIHKRLVNVPGHPIVLNCGTPTDEASESLGHHLQPIMRSGMSKLKNLKKVPNNAILVSGNVVELYPSIVHNEGLEVLKKHLHNFPEKSIPTANLFKMAEFFLKNNYFDFNSNVKHQRSGTPIVTKFVPPYACVYIYMDYMQNQFLKNEQIQPSDLVHVN